MYEGCHDLDRGISKRRHPAGFDVVMYKDDPGRYFNGHCVEVSEDVAKEASFPVERHRVAHMKKERMAAAKQTIEEELSAVEAPARKVIAEHGGFQAVDIGLGRATVLDPEGNLLTPDPLTREQAVRLVEKLAPAVVPSAAMTKAELERQARLEAQLGPEAAKGLPEVEQGR